MPVQMAQYGTKHSHAEGKIVAMQANRDVELVGVFEPDAERRAQLADSDTRFATVHWFKSAQEMLADPAMSAGSVRRAKRREPRPDRGNRGGRQPSGTTRLPETMGQWQRVVAAAGGRTAHSDAICCATTTVFIGSRNGPRRLLGQIYAIRAQMSTNNPAARRMQINAHRGGIFYELAGHMLDQIIWVLGKPNRSTCFLRTDDFGTGERVEGFADNTLGVFEFDRAMAMVDIAAMETQPTARRYEVYGTAGSAIIVEPFEPGSQIRLCLAEATEEYAAGVQVVSFQSRSRQELYEQELDAFLRTIAGQQAPDRLPEHDILVQETLLRAVGTLAD